MKYLFLLLLVGCASCKPYMRSLKLCSIPSGSIAKCNEGDRAFELQFPTQLIDWSAMSRAALLDLGNKLQQCEDDGKLPKDDKTFENLNLCLISKSSCGAMNFSDVKNWIASDSIGIQKIKQKLDWCKRQ